ncbi:hypothetical protein KIN20_012507 [Parelaphostrongylus tenuis]|uniref:Uncharacterized protein n=1 Tax=Parelaphostrongylus tenuis TaxID=148309 RepID=A0AAD5QLV2_PARTN|nr:hypothetical protein KIN20_012507 [Parelaphostrongylus tenuis]
MDQSTVYVERTRGTKVKMVMKEKELGFHLVSILVAVFALSTVSLYSAHIFLHYYNWAVTATKKVEIQTRECDTHAVTEVPLDKLFDAQIVILPISPPAQLKIRLIRMFMDRST